jgi:hypothetical protein
LTYFASKALVLLILARNYFFPTNDCSEVILVQLVLEPG